MLKPAQNDVLLALDKEGLVVVLIILDLSTAFDSIDHALLLSRLREINGIHYQVWIISYLSDGLQISNSQVLVYLSTRPDLALLAYKTCVEHLTFGFAASFIC